MTPSSSSQMSSHKHLIIAEVVQVMYVSRFLFYVRFPLANWCTLLFITVILRSTYLHNNDDKKHISSLFFETIVNPVGTG